MTPGPEDLVVFGARDVGRVFAVTDRGGQGVNGMIIPLVQGLETPNDVAFRNGALYLIIGAPCSVCESTNKRYAIILCMHSEGGRDRFMLKAYITPWDSIDILKPVSFGSLSAAEIGWKIKSRLMNSDAFRKRDGIPSFPIAMPEPFPILNDNSLDSIYNPIL